MRDLPRRTVTGVAYGAILLGLVLAPREIFLAGLALIAALALVELASLRVAGLPAALEFALIALGLAALVYLRDLTSAPFVVFGGSSGPLVMTLLAVWAADVAAYTVGSSVGRRRMAPRLSPGKTWEGTAAGILAAAAVVVLWNRPLVGLPAWSLMAAVLIGPAALGGDLLESWVKRRAGVKDSGTLLPGHGGILDRIDSLLAAGPVVAAAILVTRGLG